VQDAAETARYYNEALGFETTFETRGEYEGNPWTFAIVERDEIIFHLTTCMCPDKRHHGLANFRVLVEDIDALYAEFQARGATMHFELTQRDWGIKDFTVEDPDGNWVEFFQTC
jgi:uncharacterized glyoxalase superfamily protein PhnB